MEYPTAPIAILDLDLVELISLAQEGTHRDLIRSPQFLKDLALRHNLPITDDWNQFLDFTRMSPEDLIKYSGKYGHVRVFMNLITGSDLDPFEGIELAIENGQLEIIKAVFGNLRNEPDKFFSGMDSLGIAAKKGQLEIVKFLIEELSSIGNYQYLHHALIQASKGQIEIVRFLIPLIDGDKSLLNCGLSSASYKGQLEIVKLLLASGADDVNAGLISAASGGHLLLAEYLVAQGADDFNSSVIRAIESNQIEMVKFFIDRGVTNFGTCFALALAIEHGTGDDSIVKLLRTR